MQQIVKFPAAITPNVRAAVFASWKETCAYCQTGKAEHVDHIIPKSLGGPDALENYVASCERCNLMKSDLILGEGFIQILQAKAARKAPKIAERLIRQTNQSDKSQKKQALQEILARDRFIRSGANKKVFQEFVDQVNTETFDLTPSQIQALISLENQASKQKEKEAKATQLKSELCDLILEGQKEDPNEEDKRSIILAQINAEHPTSAIGPLRAAIARQKQANKPKPPSRPCQISMPIPASLRDALIELLEASSQTPLILDTMRLDEKGNRSLQEASHPLLEVMARKDENPDLYNWMCNCFDGDPISYDGNLCGFSFIQRHVSDSHLAEIWVKPEMLKALKIARSLKAFAFEFTLRENQEAFAIPHLDQCAVVQKDDRSLSQS